MVPIEETVRNPCARKKTQRSVDSDDKKSHSVHRGSCPKDLRQPAVSCRCHANGDEWQQMVIASPLAKNGPALLCRSDPPDRRLTEDRATQLNIRVATIGRHGKPCEETLPYLSTLVPT